MSTTLETTLRQLKHVLKVQLNFRGKWEKSQIIFIPKDILCFVMLLQPTES